MGRLPAPNEPKHDKGYGPIGEAINCQETFGQGSSRRRRVSDQSDMVRAPKMIAVRRCPGEQFGYERMHDWARLKCMLMGCTCKWQRREEVQSASGIKLANRRHSLERRAMDSCVVGQTPD